jgi:hypothetical protein
MKKFYKGDIVAKLEDTDMHWAIISGQIFIVISQIETDNFTLIYRPFKNWIKAFFQSIIN